MLYQHGLSMREKSGVTINATKQEQKAMNTKALVAVIALYGQISALVLHRMFWICPINGD